MRHSAGCGAHRGLQPPPRLASAGAHGQVHLGSSRALGRRLTEPHQPPAHVLPFNESSASAQVHLCDSFMRWVETNIYNRYRYI